MAWLTANWMPLLVVILSVDRFLMTLFPSVTVFGYIAGIIAPLVGGSSTPASLK